MAQFEGDAVFLEEVCHWGQVLGVYSFTPPSGHSLLPACGWSHDLSVHCHIPWVNHLFGTISPSKLSSNLSLVMVFYHNNRKVTDTLYSNDEKILRLQKLFNSIK